MKTPCILWQGAKTSKGYGRCGKNDYIHRVTWEKAHGIKLPPNGVIMHRCDNPSCYNIEHLVLGTQQDNLKDASQKGRLANARPTKLSAETIATIRLLYKTTPHSTELIARWLKLGATVVQKYTTKQGHKKCKPMVHLL